MKPNEHQPITFYEMMRSSHVKRWHIVNTVGQQNVAEHQWNVTVIGLELHKALIKGNEEPPIALVLALMFHDVAEIRTGDIPTPGKAFIRSMLRESGDGDLFARMDQVTVPSIPYSGTTSPGNDPLAPEYQVVVEMADIIEAAWWIRENGVGTHAKIIADRLWDNLCKLAHKYEWLPEVNAILEALGMPYIPSGTYFSPP